jgi:hypothetical protein
LDALGSALSSWTHHNRRAFASLQISLDSVTGPVQKKTAEIASIGFRKKNTLKNLFLTVIHF